MSIISGRIPTCQEVLRHGERHPTLGPCIGQWLMWGSSNAMRVHLQVMWVNGHESILVCVPGETGWDKIVGGKETRFMPLTREGDPVDNTRDALLGVLNRLGGDLPFEGKGVTEEVITDEIWAHVQYLEKNVRDGADFRHATKVLRMVADFFPHQELPDLQGKSGQFELALGTLTQALTTLKEGISSGVESAMDTIRNQADRFTDQVRALVHTRNGEVTVVLALNNDHELEILRELGCQPMDVTRVKLGNRLTIKATRR